MRTSRAGLVAAAITVGTAIAYVSIIVSQGEKDVLFVTVVIGLIAGAAIAAMFGSGARSLTWKRPMLGASTGLLLSLGMLSLFSIGSLLLLAGIFAGIAFIRSMVVEGAGGRWVAVAATMAAAALPLALPLAQDRSLPQGCRTVGENRVVCVEWDDSPIGRSFSDGGEVG